MPAEMWSLQFVHEVGLWSLWLAPFVALGGSLVTGSYRFAIAFAVGAAFDIGTLLLIVHFASADAMSTPADAARKAGPLIGVRLAVKALLLAAAVALPALLDLWGMFVGVLMVDLTLMSVGSVKAVSQTFR